MGTTALNLGGVVSNLRHPPWTSACDSACRCWGRVTHHDASDGALLPIYRHFSLFVRSVCKMQMNYLLKSHHTSMKVAMEYLLNRGDIRFLDNVILSKKYIS